VNRILKKDGLVFLSVPNGYNDSRNIIDFYNKNKKVAKSTSGHIFFFQKETFKLLFEKTNLEVLSKKSGSIKRGLRNIGIL
jgi:hypothetical protein